MTILYLDVAKIFQLSWGAWNMIWKLWFKINSFKANPISSKSWLYKRKNGAILKTNAVVLLGVIIIIITIIIIIIITIIIIIIIIYTYIIYIYIYIYIYKRIYNKKRWLTNFTVDDLIDAYMIFFQGNL